MIPEPDFYEVLTRAKPPQMYNWNCGPFYVTEYTQLNWRLRFW